MFENNNYRRRKRRARVATHGLPADLGKGKSCSQGGQQQRHEGEENRDGGRSTDIKEKNDGNDVVDDANVAVTDQSKVGQEKKPALHWSGYVKLSEGSEREQFRGRIGSASGASIEDISEDEDYDVSVDDVNADPDLAAATKAMAAETMATVDAEMELDASHSSDDADRLSLKVSNPGLCSLLSVRVRGSDDSDDQALRHRSADTSNVDDVSAKKSEPEPMPGQRCNGSQRLSFNGCERRGGGRDAHIPSLAASSPLTVPKNSNSFFIENIIGSSTKAVGTTTTTTPSGAKESEDKEAQISSSTGGLPSTPPITKKKPDIFDKIPSPPPKLFDVKGNSIDMSALAVYPRFADPRFGGLAPALYGGVAQAGHLAHFMYASARGGAAFPAGYAHPLTLAPGSLTSLSAAYGYPSLHAGGLDSNRDSASVALSLVSAAAAAGPLSRLSPP